MKTISFRSLTLLSCLLIISCTKVSPEDPWMSFKSRESRIINTWTLEKAEFSSMVPSRIISSELELTSTEYTWTTKYDNDSIGVEDGDWRIDETDKRILHMEPSFSSPLLAKQFYLYKVSSKELWLRQIENLVCDEPYEFHFKSE